MASCERSTVLVLSAAEFADLVSQLRLAEQVRFKVAENLVELRAYVRPGSQARRLRPLSRPSGVSGAVRLSPS